MAYAALLHNLPPDLRAILRNYENVSKKLINVKWSIEFNSICLDENILPNYSNIYIQSRQKVLSPETAKSPVAAAQHPGEEKKNHIGKKLKNRKSGNRIWLL